MRTPTPADLHRLRTGDVAVLALTVGLSLTANVLSAGPSLIGRAVAAWPPVALLICTDLISRVPTSRRALGVARQVAALLIAVIAAALSYGHMVTLAADHGASDRAAHVVPLTVDGLAIVASLCLLEISARLRVATRPAAQAATTARPAGAPRPAPSGRSLSTVPPRCPPSRRASPRRRRAPPPGRPRALPPTQRGRLWPIGFAP